MQTHSTRDVNSTRNASYNAQWHGCDGPARLEIDGAKGEIQIRDSCCNRNHAGAESQEEEHAVQFTYYLITKWERRETAKARTIVQCHQYARSR